MPLTSLAHFYRVRLRSRLVAELLALAGLAVGVALVFAALIASTSLTGSVRQLTDGIVGDADFQLAARSTDGFPKRVFVEVREMPGVAAAAPIAEARANLLGAGGFRSVLIIGGDARFDRVGGSLLGDQAPGRRGQRPGLVLPAPLAAALGVVEGDVIRVETGARTTRVRVAGELGGVGSLAESPVALGPLRLVQALAGLGSNLNRVFVRAKPGHERQVGTALREVATSDRLNLAPADREVAVFERAAYPTDRATVMFSALSALVGFLFALNAMLLTVPQRRRLIADLRMAGYAPHLVAKIILLDALALGVAGSLLGLALGDLASRHLFGDIPDYLSAAFAVGSQRIVTWQSVAAAVTVGLLGACLAVMAPIRDAFSSAPRQSATLASGSGREARLIVAGLALLALTATIAIAFPSASLIGMGSLTVGMLSLLPVLMRLGAASFDSLGRRIRSPVTILAILEMRAGRARIRTLALAATGAIAVFATVSLGGARADLQRGLDAVAADVDSGADVWVALRGPANIFGTTPFTVSPAQRVALERLPGAQRISYGGGGFLDVDEHRAWVMGRSVEYPVLASQVVEGSATLADARLRGGGWLTLSRGIADHLGVEPGERVTLPTPVRRGLRVAALTSNIGWPGGGIVMNAADFAAAWGTDAPSVLGILARPGVDPAALADSVGRALGPRAALRAETSVERMRRQRATSRAGLSRLSQISAMVLVSAVLAMAASMGGMIWQRRPTFAALKVHGLSEGELWGGLMVESGLLLGSGCLIGAAFGLLGQALLDRALETITGFPVFYEIALSTALGVLALLTAVAVAALALPGWLAVRVRPMTGIAE